MHLSHRFTEKDKAQVWMDKTGQEKTSDQFYRDYIEKVIISVKDKLD